MDGTPHWPLSLTLPLAILAAGILGAYWWRLGRPDVPPRRRKIRRVANLLMGLILGTVVLGTSIIDPRTSVALYAGTWLLTCLLVLALITCALVDVVDVIREHARAEARATRRTAEQLLEQLRREGGGGDEDRSRDDEGG